MKSKVSCIHSTLYNAYTVKSITLTSINSLWLNDRANQQNMFAARSRRVCEHKCHKSWSQHIRSIFYGNSIDTRRKNQSVRCTEAGNRSSVIIEYETLDSKVDKIQTRIRLSSLAITSDVRDCTVPLQAFYSTPLRRYTVKDLTKTYTHTHGKKPIRMSLYWARVWKKDNTPIRTNDFYVFTSVYALCDIIVCRVVSFHSQYN